MPAVADVVDAPPTQHARAVVARDDVTDVGGPVGRSASLEGGTLRVTCADGVELVRPAAWLRAFGDGRDAIDVVLRPGGTAITVTWRDGRRARFGVGALRT